MNRVKPASGDIRTCLSCRCSGLVLVAQIQMGESWRIGIEEQTRSPLVQHGLFDVSRLGMIVVLVGLLLTVPTSATLLVAFRGLSYPY
jgi:protein-S-isoprenylcysteine O-methyltransferase Ste14